jgi:hypothetical protein
MKRFNFLSLFVLCAALFITCFQTGFAEKSQTPGDNFVKTESGLPIKLIVVKKDAVYRPKLEENVEKPIEPLNISWLVEPEDGKDGFYRFSYPESKKTGWIKKEFVQQWKTAFTLSPLKDTDFSVYDKNNESKEILKLSKDADKDIVKFLKHNVFILDSADGKSFKPEESKEVIVAVPLEYRKDNIIQNIQKNLSLETVFVIDTTGSMMPCIEVVKEVIQKTAEELKNWTDISDKIRFGLVEYRDQEDMPNACRTVCKLTPDFATFQNALNGLEVDGGGDIPEEVYCGLREAIKNAGWSGISSKHIFLAGDAPAKGEGEEWKGISGLSLDDILELAHPSETLQNPIAGTNIHCIVAGDGKIDDIAKKQFEKLSQNGKSGGKECFVELNTASDESKKQAIENLNTFASGFEDLKRAREEGIGARGKIDPTKSVFSSSFYETLVTVNDPVIVGIANDRNSDGSLIAGKRVFILEHVTNNLISQLRTLYSNLKKITDTKSRQNTEVIIDGIVRVMIPGTTAGTEVTDDTKLRDIIAKDFPITIAILEETPKTIARMGQDRFDKYCDELLNVRKRLERLNKDWTTIEVPDDFDEDNRGERYQFVPLATF